ncbi:MAG: hypothetical protein M1840_009069 [Geoglossum simile]|nr:MAG: hypothetical protein M1840_009069 [Geoglossum simile]
MPQYRELDVAKNEIRLVRLLPSSNSSLVRCELVYTSLDKAKSERFYETLSYTWGGSAAGHSIVLNGQRFNVTDNLHAALLELRLKDQARYLWVDAICINQSDTPERNREVLRMLSIYQNAQQVVVWLGTEIPYTSTAISYLVHLEQKWREQSTSPMKRSLHRFSSLVGSATLLFEATIRTAFNVRGIRRILFWSAVNYGLYRTFGNWSMAAVSLLFILIKELIPAMADFILQFFERFKDISSARLLAHIPEPSIMDTLKDLFGRDWFTRVWIIQEIAAASYAIVQCGPHQIPWTTFSAACKQLAHETSLSWTRHPYADTGFQRAFNIVSTLATKGISTKALREKRSLLSLLSEFNVANATRAHDKVYGLLGLASEVQETSTSSPALKAHYESPVEQVYTQVARYMIESSGNLRVLHACLGTGDMTLPSWVPDWSYSAWRCHEGTGECFQLPELSDTTPVAKFFECGRRIQVEGFAIGILKDVMESLDADEREDLRVPMQIGKLFVGMMFNTVKRPLSWVGLGWFTYLLGKIDAKLSAEVTSYFDFYQRLKKKSQERDAPVMTLQEDESTSLLQQKRMSRNFWTTRLLDFKYLNWPCQTWASRAETGDVLCLFRGADRPMLLRPCEDDWQLIGPAGYGGSEMFLWERAVKLYSESRLEMYSFIIS